MLGDGGRIVQVGRSGGGALQRYWGRRAAWRVLLPSVPLLGSGAVGSCAGRCPRELGEEEKSGARGSRPHTPGALWNEILINY